jgi:hypothetical protein
VQEEKGIPESEESDESDESIEDYDLDEHRELMRKFRNNIWALN